LDDGYIDYLIETKGALEYARMRETNAAVLLLLEAAFSRFEVQLVDLKLEYGIIDDRVCVIDEISGGSLRLWPYRHADPRLDQANVLSELDPDGRLDKDTYRMGGGFDTVMARFEAITGITEHFKDLP
jgi:phosphoribosylaminoimidazole-succinocarboxamide synthase